MLHLRIQLGDPVLRRPQLLAQRVPLLRAPVALAQRFAQTLVQRDLLRFQARVQVAGLAQLLLRLLLRRMQTIRLGARADHLIAQRLLLHFQTRPPVALQAVVHAQRAQLAVAPASRNSATNSTSSAPAARPPTYDHGRRVPQELLHSAHYSSDHSKPCGCCCPVPISFSSSRLPSGS